MQYTIRQVPKKIDQALRAKAKADGKSLNEAALDAMKQDWVSRKSQQKNGT